MAIYDTMQYIKPQVQTVCLGQAASAAAVLLAAGSPGKRLALPNARVLIHQPARDSVHGQASDIEIIADSDRDHWFSAQEALEYGFVDHIVRSSREIGQQNGGN